MLLACAAQWEAALQQLRMAALSPVAGNIALRALARAGRWRDALEILAALEAGGLADQATESARAHSYYSVWRYCNSRFHIWAVKIWLDKCV